MTIVTIESIEKIDNGYIAEWTRGDGQKFKRFIKNPLELSRLLIRCFEIGEENEQTNNNTGG